MPFAIAAPRSGEVKILLHALQLGPPRLCRQHSLRRRGYAQSRRMSIFALLVCRLVPPTTSSLKPPGNR
jgi:hypothetical protein